MINRLFICFFILLSCPTEIRAQEVIASDGSFSLNSQGSLSWTLGEVVTETFSTSDNFLTQGFQQKLEGFLYIGEISFEDHIIFPNPFLSEITVSSSCSESNYQIDIYDNQTKLVYTNKFLFSVPCEQVNIDLAALPAGIYFFTVIIPDSGEKFVERIIKLKNDQ